MAWRDALLTIVMALHVAQRDRTQTYVGASIEGLGRGVKHRAQGRITRGRDTSATLAQRARRVWACVAV
jgi:hypothetical protein